MNNAAQDSKPYTQDGRSTIMTKIRYGFTVDVAGILRVLVATPRKQIPTITMTAAGERRGVGIALLSILALLVTLVLAIPAQAVSIFFTTRAEFNAAASPRELITFQEFPVGPLCDTVLLSFGNDPCVFTTQGVTFTTTLRTTRRDPTLFIRQAPSTPSSKAIQSGGVAGAADEFFFDFSGNAIGFDVFTQATFGKLVSFVVTEVDGTQTSTSVFAMSPFVGTFFGAVSDIGFTRVSIFDPDPFGGTNFLIGNVAASPIPEPATMLLLGSGLAGLGLFRRRRRVAGC